MIEHRDSSFCECYDAAIEKAQVRIEELQAAIEKAQVRIEELQAEWRKYRRALNCICNPTSWGVIPGNEIDIARRALIIGEDIDIIPKAAKTQSYNDAEDCDVICREQDMTDLHCEFCLVDIPPDGRWEMRSRPLTIITETACTNPMARHADGFQRNRAHYENLCYDCQRKAARLMADAIDTLSNNNAQGNC